MRNWFSRINIPTLVAVVVFIALDRQFDVSGKLIGMLGQTPNRP